MKASLRLNNFILSSVILLTLGFSQSQAQVQLPPLWKNTLVITPAQLLPITKEVAGDPLLGLHDNGVTAPAYDIVKQAKKSLDIEIYELKDVTFRQLLVDAAKRKVKVRVIKDPSTIADGCDEEQKPVAKDKPACLEEKAFVAAFTSAGGTYTFFNKDILCGVVGKSCYMHGKLIIADKKRALVSSGNFSTMSLCGGLAQMKKKPGACNRDYTYVTSNKVAIEKLQSVFDGDLAEKARDVKKEVLGKDNKITISVSPTAAHTLITLIKSAKKQILISTQYLNEPTINAELMLAAERNVEVRTLVADVCYYGPSELKTPASKTLIRDKFDAMEKAGVQSLFFTKALKVAGKTGYNHSKAIVIDQKLGWIGSINYSEDSLFKNREFGIMFTIPAEVKKLTKSIEGDMAQEGAASWEQEKVRCAI